MQIGVCWGLSSTTEALALGEYWAEVGGSHFRATIVQVPRPSKGNANWNQTVILLQTYFCQLYSVNLHEYRQALIYGG